MMIRRTHCRLSALALAIGGLALAQLAAAQPPALEQITVTAQKREQSLKDVPISVNVVDADHLEAANINKIADLVEFVPNLSMTETAVSTQVYIRGIGSGNNQGFEQSVGQYNDGVYYGRQVLLRAPYLDLKRIEVLRGPQSILFGKNTIAGAINYTTMRPTADKQFSLDVLHEFESNQNEITAIASGPLTDTVRARLAVRGYKDDGYLLNSYKNADEPRRNESTYRLTLDWDVTSALDVSLKMERNNFKTIGRQFEVVRDDLNLFPAGATPIAGKNMAQILSLFGQPTLEANLDFTRQTNSPEQSINHVDNQTLTANYNFNTLKLTSVTAHVRYDMNELCDCDYTPANTFSVQLGETYSQLSQELRLASPTGGKFEWLAGAYYQDAEMSSVEILNIPADSLLKTVALSSADPAKRALALLASTRIWRDNGQDNQSDALFFQGKWNLTDSLRLSLGGRYTRESKDGIRRMNVLDLATNAPLTNGVAAKVYFGAFKIYTQQLAGQVIAPGVVSTGHDLAGSRNENQFTPMVNLEWDVNGQSMLYANATTGYKAGGFDARSNNPAFFEFKEEKANSYELGSKNFFLNRSVEVNAAYFYTDYRDLQVSQFDGSFGFNVGNAAKTRVQGLELDGRWAATDTLTLGYSYSWLDFVFTDFTNGNCYNRQVPNSVIVGGVQMCDYTGESGQYTPKHSVSLSLDYKRPLQNNLLLFGNLAYNYRSSQQIHDNHDPLMQIDSVDRIGLRVGVAGDHWKAAFVGKNLANEKVLTYAGNVPLSGSTFGTNTFYAIVDRGRQMAIEVGYEF